MTDDEQGSGAGVSGPGARLRAARQAQGMGVEDVASALNLERRTVEALEAEAMEALPGGPFVRGYVRAYARLVGLDGDALADRLNDGLREQAPPLRVSEPVRTAPHMPRRVAVGGALVIALVIAGGSAWWAVEDPRQQLVDLGLLEAPGERSREAGPDGDGGERTTEPGSEVPTEAPEAADGEPAPEAIVDTRPQPGEEPAAEEPSPDQSGPQAAGQGEEPETSSGLADGPALGDDTPGLALDQSSGLDEALEDVGTPDLDRGGRPVSPPEGEDGAGADDPGAADDGAVDRAPDPVDDDAPGTDPASEADSASDEDGDAPREETLADDTGEAEGEALRVEFAGPSWVEITDADGERLLYGLVDDEEPRILEGRAPFQVVIGDVTQVRLHYGGDEVDLGEHASGRVLRREVP